MKRFLICLLSFVMVITQSSWAFGAELSASGQDQVEARADNGDTAAIGQVNVSIGPALILWKPVTFTVGLTGQQDQSVTLAAERQEQKDSSEVRFQNLKAGTYTLTVSAPQFQTYTQQIEVDDQVHSVKLLTGFVKGISYSGQASHPGVLQIGDVNDDKKVDEKDRDLLVNAIDEKQHSESTDLNGDGKTDLVDLEYFAKGYEPDGSTQASVEKSLPAAGIQSSVGENTQVEGDLDLLLQKEGTVKLQPSEDAEISDENPVSVVFDLEQAQSQSGVDGILIETADDNPIEKATVRVSYEENGELKTESVMVDSKTHYLMKANSAVRVDQDSHGNIQVHLGSQVAVKKVTLTIMGMQKNNHLAEISKVEFVNGMEDRIPEPQMDIPKNLNAQAGSETFTLTWDPCVNVTGYEVVISDGQTRESRLVGDNTLTVTSFNGDDLKNYTEYRVEVQSVNGTWKSGFCDPLKVTPKPTGKPPKPDFVQVKGGYRSITVSWKDMKDTLSYNLYYKERGASEYTQVHVDGNSCLLTGLSDKTEYLAYVRGVNELGEGDPSDEGSAVTTDMNPAVMPKYHLINDGEEGKKNNHIVNAYYTDTGYNRHMEDSPLDPDPSAHTALGVVDNDPASYYQIDIWDDGGYHNDGNRGFVVELDEKYTMDTIALQQVVPDDTGFSYVRLRYWDEKNNRVEAQGVSLQQKRDKENRLYYVIKLAEPITTNKVQIHIARYTANGTIGISEVKFYHYDTLWDDIMALYQDDLHTVLQDNVTQTTINDLRKKINTPEEASKELSPELDSMERELKTAEEILANKQLKAPVEVHGGISTSDEKLGFGGLNAWQPLGVSAAAGEEITVYVGHNLKKTGSNTELQLVATQYHAEANPMSKVVISQLKIGRNTVTIPKIWTQSGYESGGSLYVQYTGKSAQERYAVRVSGGAQVPVLDLYQVSDQAEKLEKAEAYVKELTDYVNNMETAHEQLHKNSANKNVNAFDYDEENCILGAADILLDTMMLSLPAHQILAGAGEGSDQEKAARIVSSMNAVEEMMNLFYQHKGLNKNAAAAKDQFPRRHLNIRYQRMFTGAFMYASGDHIGIGYTETPLMIKGTPIQSDNGKFVSGNYFGWGIAHEIGHCINQDTYAIAEVTNNYFSVLAQADESNDGVRFEYENVYDKVTSNTKGAASNVFTQLGMYWQLHLAYDDGYNYTTYEDHSKQLESLFFARVDYYDRNPSKAPKAAENGVELKLAGDKEQDLMRLCCAAAQKDLLDFFERWGKTPDEDTIAYAAQFEKETRAIYYVNDEARAYRVENRDTGSKLGTGGDVDAVADTTAAAIDPGKSNQVQISLASQTIPAEDVLGYEITRSTISGGEVQRETVGFTTGSTFTDTVTNWNNRVITYEVTLVDKYLNRSAVKTLDSIKVSHDGSVDKTYFSASKEGITDVVQEELVPGTEEDPCEPKPADPIKRILDHDLTTVYRGRASETAEITVEFNKALEIAGFKYTMGEDSPIGDYTLYVRDEEGQWVQAAAGNLSGSAAQTASVVYFENADAEYVSTYRTTAVKLAIQNQNGNEFTVAELDLLGITGDNVDFRSTEDGSAVIGTLKSDFQYGKEEGQYIPAGSTVFTGSYKGNPAYNVVILYDQDGNIVGGIDAEGALKSHQIILAEVPEDGPIQDVADGTWIYWIQPDQLEGLAGVEKVRAELYRVNNALTNEGQRMVSDSYFEAIPQELPEITFDQTNTAAVSNVVRAYNNEGSFVMTAEESAVQDQILLDAEADTATLCVKMTPEDAADKSSMQAGIHVLHYAGNAAPSFQFDPQLSAKIQEYRYHEDTNTLNVYLADEDCLFDADGNLNVGTIQAVSSDSKGATLKVSMIENSLKLVEETELLNPKMQYPEGVKLIVGDGGLLSTYYGDVNLSKELEVDDAIAILKHMVHLEMIDDELVEQIADINQNGSIDVGDAIDVLKTIVQMKALKPFVQE